VRVWVYLRFVPMWKRRVSDLGLLLPPEATAYTLFIRARGWTGSEGSSPALLASASFRSILIVRGALAGRNLFSISYGRAEAMPFHNRAKPIPRTSEARP